LAQVEVDEVFGLVCDVAAKVPADDAVPGGVVLLVELLLDKCGNVLLDVVLLERLRGAIYCVLLHVLRHVGVLDDRLTVRHGVAAAATSIGDKYALVPYKHVKRLAFSAPAGNRATSPVPQ